MHKILLVDDEEIIRKGIAAIIDWESHGFTFIGAAQNGVEAYELILREQPHVVITDLKMPVLDGLGLIAKIHNTLPNVLFIVLSGYSEFELAKEAMHHGVKHYLLKPSDETMFDEVLREVKQELVQREQKEEFLRHSRENFDKILPLVKEQFIRDYITNRNYAQNDYDYYCNLLKIPNELINTILLQPEGEYGYEEIFILMDIIRDYFANDIIFITPIKNQILLLVREKSDDLLLELITQIKKTFSYYLDLEITVAYSQTTSFKKSAMVYLKMQEYLKYAYYLGSGNIIAQKDIENGFRQFDYQSISFDFNTLTMMIRSGNQAVVNKEIFNFFQQLQRNQFRLDIVKTYSLELLMEIIRQCTDNEMEAYSDHIMQLQRLNSLDKIQQFINDLADRLTIANRERIVATHNRIIKKVLDYISNNYGSEELSLKWLAKELVYLNVSYLSKLFIKETGEKFSHYLTRIRMERAKELIENGGDNRIYEVARSVGLGNNPQYFGHLFKRFTGYAPTEYKGRNDLG